MAISPQTAGNTTKFVERNKLGYPVLIDHGNAYAASLGLRYELPDDLAEVYRSLGIDLPEYNGEASWTLPISARIVVDPNGIVRHVDADADYKVRPDPSDTIERIRAMRGSG